MGILKFFAGNNQLRKSWLFLSVIVLLCSCATPEQQVDNLARQLNYSKTIMTGTSFEHVLYFKHGSTSNDSTLHVYIEGDGRPWLTPRKIASDPTPHEPLMIKLMSMDKESALYLGRPCYFGLSSGVNCHSWYWTSGRYSKEVVDSMQSVLEQFLSYQTFNNLVFFGYSGGGSLVMLLAKRFTQSSIVVTIAGNIDTEEWIKFHAYSPLAGLNPVKSLPLQAHIKQYHLMGENDENVPAELSLKALINQKNTQLITMPDYDHSCCWEQIWSDLLRCIEDACELKIDMQNK